MVLLLRRRKLVISVNPSGCYELLNQSDEVLASYIEKDMGERTMIEFTKMKKELQVRSLISTLQKEPSALHCKLIASFIRAQGVKIGAEGITHLLLIRFGSIDLGSSCAQYALRQNK
ncbi:hypothetical protein ACH5RR_001536 [Cinchona calisaya]|uniref:Uncharacterized protein n=1 Tax=Cinchona calisaya TaxID=153742 RepID=A0ABD3B3P4_9GENT